MEFIVNIDLVEFLVELTKKASAKSAEASGDGGIRTLVPRRVNAFRVRPVMTASIRLHLYYFGAGHPNGSRAPFLRLNYFTKLAVCLAIANSSFVGTTITVTLSPSLEMIASSP